MAKTKGGLSLRNEMLLREKLKPCAMIGFFISSISFIFLILMAAKFFKSAPEDCELLLQQKIVTVLFIIAILSAIFGCCGAFIPLCLLVVCILAATSMIIFFCMISANRSLVHKGGGVVLPGIAYKEYRLTSYGHKLQEKVSNPNKWRLVERCLHKNNVCKKMKSAKWTNLTLQEFHRKRLSSVESGCCKPSSDCNFSYVSPINWTKITANSSNYTNQDCNAWDSNPKILCFNCSSCKAGVADKYKKNWFNGVFKSVK